MSSMLDGLMVNDVFIGLVGASLIMSALYTLRGIPGKLVWTFNRMFTMYVNIKNDSEIFDWVLLWIHHSGVLKNSKRIDAYYCPESKTWLTSPAEGTHYVWYKNRLIVINRNIGETRGKIRAEEISLRVIGASREIVNDIMDFGNEKYANKDMTRFFAWDGYWDKITSKKPRPMESIFMDDGVKEHLINDITKFNGREEWYQHMGITHRRGFLLYGPPGTGKTSLVVALSGLLHKDIYKINLGSVRDDADLAQAFSRVNAGSIILLEDIDVMGSSVVNSRDSIDDRDDDRDEKGITLSGLLNVLDGVDSIGKGTLVFMTTNYPDKLDAALIRPGRVDVKVFLDKPDKGARQRMFNRFFPNNPSLGNTIADMTDGLTQAEIQSLFVEHLDDPFGMMN